MVVTLITMVCAAVLVIAKLAGHRMDVAETGLALGACLTLFIVALVLERRPYQPGKFNYHPAMLVLVITNLILGRYVVQLTTGL